MSAKRATGQCGWRGSVRRSDGRVLLKVPCGWCGTSTSVQGGVTYEGEEEVLCRFCLEWAPEYLSYRMKGYDREDALSLLGKLG
jgi:hypothetical protein